MATQTLAELAKLVPNTINSPVAADIIETNPVFDILPFFGYEGPGIIVPREDTLGDAQALAVGSAITANAASVSNADSVFKATTLIGSVEMNGLVQAQARSGGLDMLAQEISSKAKSVGRLFNTGMATGTGSAPQMNSLASLCDASQYTTASAGQALSFDLLDELLDLVKAKDGVVDWMMMHRNTMRAYRALLRGLGGNTMEHVEMPMGPGGVTRKVLAYNGIPIFVNDFLSHAETANGAALTGGTLTSVWAGVFDDGSKKIGLSGLYPAAMPAGIQVERVGKKTDYDEEVYHVKWYTNLANFNRRGLARLTSINV
jgi:hypothetical protein